MIRVVDTNKQTNTSISPPIKIMNEEQERAFQLILGKKNVLITAPGGFGKTFFINEMARRVTRLRPDIRVAKTSMTGSSAILLNGTTMHAYLGIGICTDTMEMYRRIIKTRSRPAWVLTDILVIDEVSMLSKELFQSLDYLGKQLRNDPRPFGGLQIVLAGDFCQIGCISSSSYCFESDLWDRNIHHIIEFTRSYRQEGDLVFSKMLEQIRFGVITEDTERALRSRMIPFTSYRDGIQPTRLYSYKKDVASINQQFLEQLVLQDRRTTHEYRVRIKQKYAHKKKTFLSCVDEPPLLLCVGAQVILTVNLDIEQGLINGSRGVVVAFSASGLPVVEFVNGYTQVIDFFEHTIEERSVEVFGYTRIPLILGWAITIHKSQGMTLDLVVADMGGVFDYGQGYVTLSRVKNLQSLFLTRIDFSRIRCNPKVVEFYSSIRPRDPCRPPSPDPGGRS